MEKQRNWNTPNNFGKVEQSWRTHTTDFKTNHKSTMTKTVKCRQKSRLLDRLEGIKSPNIAQKIEQPTAFEQR